MGALRDLGERATAALAGLLAAPMPAAGKSVDAATIAVFTTGAPGRVGTSYGSLSRHAYELNYAANRAINEIALGASSVPLDVFIGEREAPSHGVALLLRRPNFGQSRTAFVRELVSHFLIDGNAFAEALVARPVITEPRALFTWRPDRVQVRRHRLAVAGETVYHYEGGEEALRSGQIIYRVPDLEDVRPVMHWKSFHPTSDLRGLSPLMAARPSIDRHNLAEEWNTNLIRHGDGVSGVFNVRQGKDGTASLDDETRDRVLAELREHWFGPKNAGRAKLLEGDLEYQQTAMTPQEMEWSQSNYAALRAVCNVLGYPPFLLGIPGDNTYSNQREARAALWENTIVPLLLQLCDELGGWLGAQYTQPELRIVPNLDGVTALAPRREQTWDRVKDTDWISTDEKRSETGFEELGSEEAREVLIGANLVPLSVALEPPAPLPPELGGPPGVEEEGEDAEEAAARRLAEKAEELFRLAERMG